MKKPALGNLGRLFVLALDVVLEKYILLHIEITYMEHDMSQRQVEVTLPKEGSTHTRFEIWGGDSFHDRYIRFDARRVVREGSDEAQIEVMVSPAAKGKNRTTTICGSVILSPDEARALALSICPELTPK